MFLVIPEAERKNKKKFSNYILFFIVQKTKREIFKNDSYI